MRGQYSREGTRSLLVPALAYSVYAILAGGFEVAMVFRLRASVADILLLQALSFAGLYGGTLLCGRLLTKGYASPAFRMSFVLQAGACLFAALCFPILGEAAILAVFFLVRGTADGFFFAVRNVLFLLHIGDAGRDQWVMRFQTFSILLGVLIPAASGLAISYLPIPAVPSVLPSGYLAVFLLAGVFSLGFVFVVPRIRIPAQRVRFKKFSGVLRDRAQRPWIALLCVGCVSGVSMAVATAVLNFKVLQSEFGMGVFASWIALSSAGFFWLLRTVAKRRSLSRVALVASGTAGEFLSRLIYALFVSLPGLVAKSFLDSFVVPLRGLLGENIVRRRQELVAQKFEISLFEIVYFQESVIFVMRIAAYGMLLILFALVRRDDVALCRLIFFLCLPLGAVEFLLLRRVDARNSRNDGSVT